MKVGALSIRRGTPRDVPVILGLIRGLAEYERLAHEAVATASQIRRHGFGRRRYFETIICRHGREPIGFALFFFTYSTFLGRPTLYLEDLFVVPAERGRGAGRALLGELARIAKRRGCGRMEWAVLDWNERRFGSTGVSALSLRNNGCSRGCPENPSAVSLQGNAPSSASRATRPVTRAACVETR
jgi:GNAT superfamily N-acetyltransferase